MSKNTLYTKGVLSGRTTPNTLADLLPNLTSNEIFDLVMDAGTPDQLIKDLTCSYFDNLDDVPSPRETAKELMALLSMGFTERFHLTGEKWHVPKELPASTLSTALSKTGDFVQILTDSNSTPQLYVYAKSGHYAGTYRYVDMRDLTGEFHKIVREWNYNTNANYRKEVLLQLADEAPLIKETQDNSWVPVANGAFNVKTQEFIPLSDPSYRNRFVFLKKIHTNYNLLANTNPILTDPDTGDVFDVDSFMDSYFGPGTDMTKLLWELFYVLVRYKKNYRVCHFFCNVDSGNNAGSNGKSTLLSLMRSLLGEGNFCSVKLHDMNKDFSLAPLHNTIAILVDEVAVDVPIVQCDILKTLATRDESVTTQKKFHDPRTGKWDGNMVFCCNGWPRILEKTGAAEKRFYFWNFTKRFVGNADKTYLQDVFVHDKRVCEYVLYKVLHMGDIKRLSRPKEIDDNLAQYRMDNCNTVHEFLNEFALPDASGRIPLVWSMQPFTWLYAFYQQWLYKDLGQSNKMTPKKFRQEVISWSAQHTDIWKLQNCDVHRPKGVMEQNEPLIGEYEVKSWYGSIQQVMKPNGGFETTFHPALVDTYTRALIRK